MRIKERNVQSREHTRNGILKAAMVVARKEGWDGLSMRKIADIVTYSVPVIYEHFTNKDAILLQLSKDGHRMLMRYMQSASDQNVSPESKIEAMWIAYWDFAFSQKELYQLMFGIGTPCSDFRLSFIETEIPTRFIKKSIVDLMDKQNPGDDEICKKFYTFWSVAHGLVAITLINRGVSEALNLKILKHAIKGVIGILRN